MSTTTSSHILHHTTAFTSRVLSNSKLRRHLITTLHHHIQTSTNQELTSVTLKHLNLAAETLETSFSSSTTTTTRSSSLSLAEKLLLPLPPFPLSSFLLSLIHSLRNRHTDSSLSLLTLFLSVPSLARSEIAPSLYDHLFSLHLLPVFHWFDDQRTRILSSASPDLSPYGYSVEDDESVVMPSEKLLSRMSGDQATKLREVEREYEEVLDENCRVLAVYFREVLVNKNGDGLISTPTLLLPKGGDGGGGSGGGREKSEQTEMPVLENGRYNVIIYFCCLFASVNLLFALVRRFV